MARTWSAPGAYRGSPSKAPSQSWFRSAMNSSTACARHLVRAGRALDPLHPAQDAGRVGCAVRKSVLPRARRPYNARLNARQAMTNEFYLTLVYRPGHAALGKRAHHGQAEVRRQLLAHIRRMDEIGSLIETTLRSHGEDHEQAITVTGLRDGQRRSAIPRTLTLLEFLAHRPLAAGTCASRAAGRVSRFEPDPAGAEMMELRSPTCRRYAQFIDFKEYGTHTEPGMLNALLYEDYEYVITHSFSAVGKRQALAYLQRQRASWPTCRTPRTPQIDDPRACRRRPGQWRFRDRRVSLLDDDPRRRPPATAARCQFGHDAHPGSAAFSPRR